MKEDLLLCAPLRAVVMRRLCSVDCVEGRRHEALLISSAATATRRRAREPRKAKLIFQHEGRNQERHREGEEEEEKECAAFPGMNERQQPLSLPLSLSVCARPCVREHRT